ncbi:hypothetical protein [Histophilus somni]|uniref:hypothetical protein n=1 Tax=Histophilus somni TaxID=731 RepID=UPI00201F3667|nr:hypothetical protein [Histophilus somni]
MILFVSIANANTYTTDNINKILLKDKLQKMFDISYSATKNLPMTLDDANALKKANLLRSIAQKSTRAAVTLGKRHPVTALGVALGADVLLDGLIDDAFQKFTSAEKDEKGFFVWVNDPQTGLREKFYLDEQPTQKQPLFVYRQENEVVFFWKSEEYEECKNQDFDVVLNCALHKSEEEFRNDSLFVTNNVKASASLVEEDDDFKKYELTVSYCMLSDCNRNFNSELVFNREQTEISVTKKYRAIAGSDSSVLVKNLPNNKPFVQSADDISIFLNNLIKLNSQEFTEEERKIMDYAFSPFIISQVIPDTTLTKDDILEFEYQEDMFDKSKKTISTGGNTGTSTSNSSSNNEDNYGDPTYPELTPPTAYQILEPFKQFFPELQNIYIQERGVSCPTWSFDALGHTYTIDGHCPILEKNRDVLSSLLILIWSIIAIRKLLSA